jgi:hypothetical protein
MKKPKAFNCRQDAKRALTALRVPDINFQVEFEKISEEVNFKRIPF